MQSERQLTVWIIYFTEMVICSSSPALFPLLVCILERYIHLAAWNSIVYGICLILLLSEGWRVTQMFTFSMWFARLSLPSDHVACLKVILAIMATVLYHFDLVKSPRTFIVLDTVCSSKTIRVQLRLYRATAYAQFQPTTTGIIHLMQIW